MKTLGPGCPARPRNSTILKVPNYMDNGKREEGVEEPIILSSAKVYSRDDDALHFG